MRMSLGATIVLMGLIGMGLVMMTGEFFRQVAIEAHRTALVDLVRLKAQDILDQGRARLDELGLAIQHGAQLGPLVRENDAAALQTILNSQFHQYFVTAGVGKLEKLFVLDTDYQQLARSSEGAAILGKAHDVCPTMLHGAAARVGAMRLQSVAALCVQNGTAYQAVLVPIGGLRVAGYLLALADPAYLLRKLETALEMPIELRDAAGRELYRSQRWAQVDLRGAAVQLNHLIHGIDGESALHIGVIADVSPFYFGLARQRDLVLLAASIATLLAVAVALWLLQRTTLQPLQVLTRQLQLLRQDKRHLGEHVSVGGNREIQQLAWDFNKMTSELRGLYTKLETLAYVDPVTKLANRARFHDMLHSHADTIREGQRSFALFLIDVERFKAVNDSLGHSVGDQLLTELGARIEQVLRKSDITTRLNRDILRDLAQRGYGVARLGGDEFAILLPQLAGAEQARVVADKLLDAMAQPFELGGNSFNIHVRIGIVLAPEHGSEPSALLRRADVAVAEAKRTGTGFHIYDAKDDQHRLFQLGLERELRQALERDALELYYQPQLTLDAAQVHGVEALLRWKHPERGFISPDTFIPLAEQSGLIQPLTEWVLERAAAFGARMRAQGQPITVAVNLSARCLQDRGLRRTVEAALLRSGLPAGDLVLEITESAVMAEPERALATLTGLHTMGLMLSIDDFGTGYSSMAYLRQLPVGEIKIDRSFVMEMKTGNSDQLIVRAIVDLAHNLRLRCVAEGVETQAVWQELCGLGCDIAQGYFMAKPMPEAKLIEWLVISAPDLQRHLARRQDIAGS